MDIATIIGIISAFGLMILAILQGSPLEIFFDLPAMLIVVGGSAGVALIHFPLNNILSAANVAKKAFLIKEKSPNQLIIQLIEFANKARKEGILSLQEVMSSVDDDFFIKALQMAIDGQEPEDLKAMLTIEIDYIEERHLRGADIFTSLATISPSMGMVGTLIGLVQMLQNMNDPYSIGPAMALALLTTFYGSVIGNIICNPIAGKLRNRSKAELLTKTLIVGGMDSILTGENPRVMKQKLLAYIAPSQRKSVYPEQRTGDRSRMTL